MHLVSKISNLCDPDPPMNNEWHILLTIGYYLGYTILAGKVLITAEVTPMWSMLVSRSAGNSRAKVRHRGIGKSVV